MDRSVILPENTAHRNRQAPRKTMQLQKEFPMLSLRLTTKASALHFRKPKILLHQEFLLAPTELHKRLRRAMNQFSRAVSSRAVRLQEHNQAVSKPAAVSRLQEHNPQHRIHNLQLKTRSLQQH